MAKMRSYKFAERNHTRKGILSTILGGASLLVLIVLIYISFLTGGQAGLIIGAAGLCGLAASLTGFCLGLLSFREKDRYYLFSTIGSFFNLFVFILWMIIILFGM